MIKYLSLDECKGVLSSMNMKPNGKYIWIVKRYQIHIQAIPVGRLHSKEIMQERPETVDWPRSAPPKRFWPKLAVACRPKLGKLIRSGT